MTIGTTLYTWFCGKKVGSDEFGNAYYTERSAPKSRRAKRWVIYSGMAEATLVPPDWHGWLHYTVNTTPTDAGLPTAQNKNWIKPHQQNLSGSVEAYLPPGHVLRGGNRDHATGDYEAWTPN
jgi:NADH:ubiquinone oxidoreductase subunit